MKKVITLLLALALVLTSVVAIAEEVEAAAPKATPNINTFATMKVKYYGAKFNNVQNWNKNDNYYLITLSKPVDRLLVKWAEKGAEPEELAVDENLKATALTWGHKQMPGTTQYYNTSVKQIKGSSDTLTVTYTEKFQGYVDLKTSEKAYAIEDSTSSGTKQAGTKYVGPKRVLDNMETYVDEAASYVTLYDFEEYDFAAPYEVYDAKTGEKIVVPGYIKGEKYVPVTSVIATPADTAFMTVQGEWAVYYNRAGKIVGIEYFDGQF